ncbi:MAG TPA: M24 family metallopeptidase [Opitutaceae bacterium]|nr:M24 family metallopeptidase [Opitutaceae bacterium]
MKSRDILLYSDTAKSADALYFGGVNVPDPFIALSVRGRKFAVVSALEFGRVKRDSDFAAVLPLESWLEKARRAWPRQKPGPARVIALLSRELKAGPFTVPEDFPAGLYKELRDLGLPIRISAGALFPEREIKSPSEAAAIREGNRCSAAGIAAAESVLRTCRVRAGRLIHRGSVLTSERLKVAIEIACIEAGSISDSTIAAGGDQACDPHNRGSGPLRANQLIIVDVFPRVAATGFYGDMTRTFLRGRASDAQRAIVAAVRAAQLAALATIRAGVNGTEVHRRVSETFVARGFETRRTPRGSVGFFHGTGHGVGLEVHEPPRMNATLDYALKKGSVVTVEPGLYYPGVGACRIEDVVQVTGGAPRMLSRYPYAWELR